MKILHIIRSVNPATGGPIEGLLQISSALNRMGTEISVLSLDAGDEPFVSSFPLKLYAKGSSSKDGYGYSAKFIPWLKSNIRNYNCVIVNGLWQYHGFAAMLVCTRLNVPYFVFSHGMLDPWFKKKYPLKHLKKWLYWPWAEYRVLKNARAVLFTCEEERVLARESFWLYSANEKVVSYGTSLPAGDKEYQKNIFSRNFPLLAGKRFFLFLSRIQQKKGCDILIEAFAKVSVAEPDLHLVMAGPDQVGWVAELKLLANKLGISERITWVGMLSGDEKWGAFYSAEAFVLPSHQENFGIAVAEALACGLPVLISNKVNIWREIEADGAGIVGRDDVQDTVRVFQNWLSLSQDEKTAFGSSASRCFFDRFEITKAASKLLEIYESVG